MTPLGPFGQQPRLAAGVSGGPHSLALAFLARDWVVARGGSLLALIVDHGLRDGSGAEAARVRDRLESARIPARVIGLGLASGTGVQDRARAARLEAMLAACRAEARPWLLLGHHAGDQAETLLTRALAGSGTAGLAAMAPVRAAAEALILRPLLGVSPERLEATIAAAGLAPERDPSNADARFVRVRLRGAATEAGQPALFEAAERFARRRAAREGAVAARLAASAMISASGFARIDPAALGRDALAAEALGVLVRLVGGADFAPPGDAVAALLAQGRGTLGGAWLRPASGGGWLLLREAAALAPPVPALRGAVWDGRFRLTGEGAEGHWLGALGREFVTRHPPLPALLRATLPAIRDTKGRLAALPTLDYPSSDACRPFALAFAPQGGAPLGWASFSA
ncbi:MAG: tRNA lysidine(34) synthetase TilS [Pseudomonadota bacterium]